MQGWAWVQGGNESQVGSVGGLRVDDSGHAEGGEDDDDDGDDLLHGYLLVMGVLIMTRVNLARRLCHV